MDIEEIKEEFGDCDWMQAFLNGYTVDAVLWLMNRVEELEQHTKEDKGDKTMQDCQVEKNEGQVNQELNNAENAASQLGARIDEMEGQLSGVLHEVGPPSSLIGAKLKEEKAPLVPLASRIENHYIVLQTLGTRVREMLARLELR